MECVLEGKNIEKKYKGFTLNIPEFKVPKGFATALIGENGAGKTTLMSIMAGIQLQYKGEITYFGQFNQEDREKTPSVKEKIGYTAPGLYYLPQWKVNQISAINELLFEGYHKERFERWCEDFGIQTKGSGKKKVSELSDGNRMKLMIAGVLARDTELLLLDEPASPLDPVMRDRLCEIIREYLNEEEGQRSVFFSTHNIADMENVTDYAVIMANGEIAETGFVEELKEKYVLVKGEETDAAKAKEYLYSMTQSRYGFEGICLAENLDKLAGMQISAEVPTLTQISVAIMKHWAKKEK